MNGTTGTALEAIIRQRIAAEGPMPLADYMALCLGHKQHGYYHARPAIGSAGDFTTAPEISQMFGEIVGAWLAHAWELTGRPGPVGLVELGPGRGTLMADILRTFRLLPDLEKAVRLHLVETSAAMRQAQADRLSGPGHAPRWHGDLDSVPAGAALFVANEFFDALPIRQLIRRGNAWYERHVVPGGGGFVFCDGIEARDGDVPAALRDSAEGTIVEICPAAREIASRIGARLSNAPGAALFIDYGYRGPAAGDSLQALRDGIPADPLATPGEADLTAHVDFAALAAAATSAGAVVHGPVTQSSFLTALGIGLRAERLRSGDARASDVAVALERLTGAQGMGRLFKVIALTSPGLPAPPPFDTIV